MRARRLAILVAIALAVAGCARQPAAQAPPAPTPLPAQFPATPAPTQLPAAEFPAPPPQAETPPATQEQPQAQSQAPEPQATPAQPPQPKAAAPPAEPATPEQTAQPAAPPGAPGTEAQQAPTSQGARLAGVLHFTTSGGCETGANHNVHKVSFNYIVGSKFTLDNPQGIACTKGADGIAFAPDGDLLIGGQGDRVHKVDPKTGKFSTVNAGGQDAFHIAVDPSGARAWTTGIPGGLTSIPLRPFAGGTAIALTGDDTIITSIAWDRSGRAYYTAGGAGGYGTFGRIDLGARKTTRILTDLPAAHGMIFDPFTGDLILVGDNHITQITPGPTPKIVSDLDASVESNLDQVAVDGRGHLFAAANGGQLVFVDFSATGKVADPKNFRSAVYVVPTLDDIAPLVGPGSQGWKSTLGELRVQYAPEVGAIGRNLEIILDASGSMNTKLGSSTRWKTAQQVLADLVRQLPADINVSLRVFGHRMGGPASCKDTELLVPPGPVNAAAIIGRVNALRARGETPLVANLLLAGKDLARTKAGTVVAITDGEESCGGNTKTVAAQLQAQGVQLVVNIVGFNLPNAKAIADWRGVAQSTGGRFFDAKTAGDLSAALREAVRLEYVVYDRAGIEVARAHVGETLELPEGTYTVVVRAGVPVKVEGVKVSAREPAVMVLRRQGAGWALGLEKAK